MLKRDNNSYTPGRFSTQFIFLDQTLVSGFGFLTGLLLARYLGMAGYGRFVLANGIILFVSSLQIALISSPMMIKWPAVDDENKKDYFRAIIIQQLLSSTAIGASIILIGKLIEILFPYAGLGPTLWPLSAATACFVVQDFFRRYFIVINRPASTLFNDLVSYGIRVLVLVCAGLWMQLTAELALWIIAATAGVATLIAIFQVGWSEVFRKIPSALFRNVVKENWVFGKWLLATSILVWLQNQMILYLCAGLLSVEAVGAMGACRNFMGLANILFLALQNMAPPRASYQYHRKGSLGLHRYLKRICVWGGFITAGIILPAAIWGEFWLKLVYGAAYSGYGWIIWWWALFTFIAFFSRIPSVGLNVLERTKEIFRGNLAAALLAITISYPALHIWSINGAMAALCIVQVLMVVMLTFKYYKGLRIWSRKVSKRKTI